MTLKKYIRFCLLGGLCCFAVGVMADIYITLKTASYVFHDHQDLPSRPVALVLGTSKYVGKQPNRFYTARIETAAQLYHLGKIKGILVSGDNSSRYYNEPITMQRDLMAAGVPAEYITLDYAGFRTLDSVIRANAIFDQQDFIVVSQRFHVERAVYLGRMHGLDILAYPTADKPALWQLKVRIREIFARVKALLDIHLLQKQPRYLGEKVPIRLRPDSTLPALPAPTKAATSLSFKQGSPQTEQ